MILGDTRKIRGGYKMAEKQEPSDACHNGILNDPVAHERVQLAAVMSAIEEGLTAEDAWALYGNSIPHLRKGFEA